MAPEYVQKLLTLLGETEYTTNLVVAGPEDDVETGSRSRTPRVTHSRSMSYGFSN